MTLSQWSNARAHKDFDASLQTYQVGARFEALLEGVLMEPLDSRYTDTQQSTSILGQVVINLMFVECASRVSIDNIHF